MIVHHQDLVHLPKNKNLPWLKPATVSLNDLQQFPRESGESAKSSKISSDTQTVCEKHNWSAIFKAKIFNRHFQLLFFQTSASLQSAKQTCGIFLCNFAFYQSYFGVIINKKYYNTIKGVLKGWMIAQGRWWVGCWGVTARNCGITGRVWNNDGTVELK